MRKIFLILLSLVATITVAYSQAKKPTIMVVPSDAWCFQNGYITEFDNMGKIEKLPDYEKALMENPDLIHAISKIGEMMSERGFSLKDLSQSIRSVKNITIEESLMISSEAADGVAQSPLDRLKQVAQADIWMQLTYSVHQVGPKRSLTFNLQGIDVYTNKQVAAASGTGIPSFSAELPVLLHEGVLSHIDGFNNQLQTHFNDLFEKGREVSLICNRWNGSDMNFETEYNNEELSFIIEEWIADNTVEGRFSTLQASENRLYFEQVRIPVENERGRALDTRTWANGLRQYLKKNFDIESKLSVRGLGQAIITVGYK